MFLKGALLPLHLLVPPAGIQGNASVGVGVGAGWEREGVICSFDMDLPAPLKLQSLPSQWKTKPLGFPVPTTFCFALS